MVYWRPDRTTDRGDKSSVANMEYTHGRYASILSHINPHKSRPKTSNAFSIAADTDIYSEGNIAAADLHHLGML